MKIIIALVCVVALAAAATTLAETGSYKFMINFSKNSSNSSNSDFYVALQVGDASAPMANDYYTSGVCYNVGTSNYQLSAQNSTLQGFAMEWKCGASCNALTTIYGAASNFYTGAVFQQTTAHAASTTTGLTSRSGGANSADTSSKEARHTFTGITPTLLSSTYYLPNQTETFYVRCWARFNNSGTATFGSAVGDLTTLGNAKNLSLKGNGYTAATVLAVAGSLVAALA